MAITDSQKVDYLFKKVGYSVAKTDTSSVKSPSNESIASPLVVRGGTIWTNSDNIPSTIPVSNSSVVSLYKDSLTSTVQTTNDGTASANRTWLTNLTDWIDPSFGSTYQVKVYLDTAGNTAPQTTGTQLFADGTGSDEWFFDYASGVLNFIGTSLPSVSFTGKRIFVSGARYIGNKGLGNLGNTTISGTITADAFIQNGRAVLDTITSFTVTGDATGSGNVSNISVTLANTGVIAGIYGSADDEYTDRIPKITVDSKGRITNIANVTLTQVGNVTFTNTTISTTSGITINSANNGNIILNANGTGVVQITGNDAVGLPYGNTAVRPTNVQAGYLRYNTDLVTIEYYNGSTWENNLNISGYLSSETIYPTGATNNYTLISPATTDGVLVSINGTLQQPTTAYTVSGNVITFTETPLSSDVIEVRAIAMNLVSIPAISDGAIRLTADSATGNITAIGNLVMSSGYGIVTGNISAGNVTATNFIGTASLASAAATLQTARTINGVSFNGSANITLPTVNTTGNQDIYGTKRFIESTTRFVQNGYLAGPYSVIIEGYDFGDSYGQATLAIRATDISSADIKIGVDTSSSTNFIMSGGTNNLIIGTNNTERVRIDATGNVGIGTSSPTAKLHVVGNAIVTGNISSNGFTLGYLEMPQVSAGNVTLALSDSGKHFYDTSPAPQTITIPNNANVAFPIGTVITLVNQSTGNLIVGRQNAANLFLGGNATSAGRTITTYGVATLLKVATDTWFINGTGIV